MRPTRLMAVVVFGTLLVAACTGSSTTNGPTSSPFPTTALVPPSDGVPASTAPSTAPSSSDQTQSAAPTGAPTTLDPCQLVTVEEASALAGTTFGPGAESDTGAGGKKCVYGAQTKNVFSVLVGVAGSVAIAKAGEAEAEAALAKLATKGVKFTEVKSFAPGADAAFFVGPLGAGINGAAVYVLAGTTVFGFSDLVLGGPAPTLADIEAQANVTLGRIP